MRQLNNAKETARFISIWPRQLVVRCILPPEHGFTLGGDCRLKLGLARREERNRSRPPRRAVDGLALQAAQESLGRQISVSVEIWRLQAASCLRNPSDGAGKASKKQKIVRSSPVNSINDNRIFQSATARRFKARTDSSLAELAKVLVACSRSSKRQARDRFHMMAIAFLAGVPP